jgi:uncharacterized protein YaiI (UPF0178 family)
MENKDQSPEQASTNITVPQILVDADACPVKEEIYKVAFRHSIQVLLVSNAYLRIPQHALISQIVVSDGFDAADDHIAEVAHPKAVVITSDIPLAERSIKMGALVLRPDGKPFTENSIGMALATRAIMADLRAGGEQIGGPPPFTKAARSQFLVKLDEIVVKLKRI